MVNKYGRPLAGRLNGIDAPIGTVVGPRWTREMLVVIGVDETGADLGYAQPAELADMAERIAAGGVQSVTEHRYRVAAQ